MAFIGAWTINDWTPDSNQLPDGIPADGVRQDSSLYIAPEPTTSSNTFRLLWLDQNGDPCTVSGLQSDQTQTTLQGQGLLVNFGAKEVSCDVNVVLVPATDPQELTCTINKSGSGPGLKVGSTTGATPQTKTGPEVGSGTFTATADPGPSVGRKR